MINPNPNPKEKKELTPFAFTLTCPHCQHILTPQDFDSNHFTIAHLQSYFASKETIYKNQLLAQLTSNPSSFPAYQQIKQENEQLKLILEGYKLGTTKSSKEKGEDLEKYILEQLQTTYNGQDDISKITHVGTKADINPKWLEKLEKDVVGEGAEWGILVAVCRAGQPLWKPFPTKNLLVCDTENVIFASQMARLLVLARQRTNITEKKDIGRINTSVKGMEKVREEMKRIVIEEMELDCHNIQKCNAQKYINQKYPTKEERKQIKELNISRQNLESDLDLSDFVNLETLDCSYNQLTNLNINNCSKLKNIKCGFNKLTNLDLTNLTQLEKISCNDNYLESFDYSSLNPNKLISLNITDNNLPQQDCSVFKPLKNLTKLKSLYISNTDIDSVLEHLPKNIENICCSSQERPTSKIKELEEQLKNNSFFDFKSEIKYNQDDQEHENDQKLKTEYQEEYKQWVDIHEDFFAGLSPYNYELVAYARYKGYHPQQISREELEKEYHQAENYLAFHYPKEKREQITELNIGYSYKKLIGELDFSGFKNLKSLICNSNNLTNCNFLSTLSNPEKLIRLDLSDNDISQDLTVFSRFKNLRSLNIDNNSFTGSLVPLAQCENLESLNISNTDINSDVGFQLNDYDFACYLARKGYQPKQSLQSLNYEGLRDEYYNKSQKKKRSEVEEIYLNEPSLEGELDLGNFTYCNDTLGGVKVYISSQ
ncbi:37554_t:CDS:10, partial [Gigaspora margarita]